MGGYTFESEHREFLRLLYEHQVDYMLIGGAAVNLHGYTRGTGDLDILFNPSGQNKQKLMRAIEDLGYDTTEFSRKQASEITMFTLGERTHQGHIELTNRIAGISYEKALLRKQQARIDGVVVSYIHLDDLLKNKRAAGRQKDLIDVEKLQQIRQIQEQDKRQFSRNKVSTKPSLWQRIKQIINPKKKDSL